jgi:hypothetical protein
VPREPVSPLVSLKSAAGWLPLCVYTLKIAMLFEAASLCHDHRWTYGQTAPLNPPLILHADTLELAIAHVEECFKSAQSLTDVADQKIIREQAETLLDNIRGGDFTPSKDRSPFDHCDQDSANQTVRAQCQPARSAG